MRQLTLFVPLIALSLVLLFWYGAHANPPAANLQKVTKWEYKLIYARDLLVRDSLKDLKVKDVPPEKLRSALMGRFAEQLNELGAQGWEMCAVTEKQYFFKRPVLRKVGGG